MDLYERRFSYAFAEGTPLSRHLPVGSTPEAQVAACSLWEFFVLVRYKGGYEPYFEWHEENCLPVVVLSPVIKLTEGPDLPFGARWCLMQHYPWRDRKRFLDMTDTNVAEYFREWRSSDACPWYIKEQYINENGRRARGGAGPTTSRSARDKLLQTPGVDKDISEKE